MQFWAPLSQADVDSVESTGEYIYIYCTLYSACHMTQGCRPGKTTPSILWTVTTVTSSVSFTEKALCHPTRDTGAGNDLHDIKLLREDYILVLKKECLL
jgi:hypothetical protein